MGTVLFLKCQCWGISVACEAHLRFGDPPVPMFSIGVPSGSLVSFEAPAPLLAILEWVCYYPCIYENKVPFTQCGLPHFQVRGAWLPQEGGDGEPGAWVPGCLVWGGTPLVFPLSQCPFCAGS